MQGNAKPGRRRRRLSRKYGQALFIGFVILIVTGFVVLLMWLLNKPIHSGP